MVEVTGYEIGSIPPFHWQPPGFRSFVDTSLMEEPVLGVGGGIVVVPVLFHLFAAMGVAAALAMNLAVGTSLAIIISTSISSMCAHHRHGAVDMALLRRWGAPVFLGAVIGVAVAGLVGGAMLTVVFACGGHKKNTTNPPC